MLGRKVRLEYSIKLVKAHFIYDTVVAGTG